MKMKQIKLLAVIALIVFSNNAQAQTWTFDNSHSSVGFAVEHMVVSEVDGSFSKFTGAIISEKADFSDAKIEFEIDVNSINTNNEKRDEHLKSEDFFNTAKYPSIVFKSNSFTKISEDKYSLKGNLTMHGITKPVELNVKHGGTIKDPWGNTRAGFKIKGTLDRKLWGLTYNSVLEAGGVVIGEEIEIICKIELIKK